jgi:hypothetical protein
MAEHVKVLGIQFPHNATLRSRLIDPMHDPGVPGNCVSEGPDSKIHDDLEWPVRILVDLASVRMTADIVTLGEALKRMPELKKVRAGNFADEQVRGLRAPVQVPRPMTMMCVEGHYRPTIRLRYEQLYHIVIAAVASIIRPAGEEQVTLSMAVNSSPPRIVLSNTTKALLATIWTRVQISFDDPHKTIHCASLSDASPEALEMRYSRMLGDPSSPLPNITTPLKSLTVIQGCFSSKGVVSGLMALWRPMMQTLVAFLDYHKDTLEIVKLLQCKMVKNHAPDPGTWLPILGKLKEMKKLEFLEFDRLKSEANKRDDLNEKQSG